jgi:hypothetical protein
MRELRVLWKTRHSSGFPWPFRWGLRAPSRRAYARQLLTGDIWYSTVPLRKQLLRIPLRPIRYVQTVRRIARVRAMTYHVRDYDSVP